VTKLARVANFHQAVSDDLLILISEGAGKVTPLQLDRLVRRLPEIRLRVTQIEDFPHLADQVEFLSELVEDFQSGLSRNIPFVAIAEAAFSLKYLLKGVDIIPDNIPGAGFADDAAIISLVMERWKSAFLREVMDRNAKDRAKPALDD
jgi:uncharacterized membrane protein YkvA (DUF1232 family)